MASSYLKRTETSVLERPADLVSEVIGSKSEGAGSKSKMSKVAKMSQTFVADAASVGDSATGVSYGLKKLKVSKNSKVE